MLLSRLFKAALAAGAKVMVMSHLGRPDEGVYDEAASLAPVAKYLSEKLGRPVCRWLKDWVDGFADGRRFGVAGKRALQCGRRQKF